MKKIIELLNKNSSVSDYKVSTHSKESYEMFFVKGRLETVRCTDTCDKEVTVYVNHGEFKGDSVFYVYPSDTEKEIEEKIGSAVNNALLIQNKAYELPEKETGEFTLQSNFEKEALPDLAAKIANAVFDANNVKNGSLNSVEIFINKLTDTVMNSKGLNKTQHRYSAMVEAIPTYNGENQSVELYEQYNFSSLDLDDLTSEIADKMTEVKARYEAEKPSFPIDCKVVLNKLELADLFGAIEDDLNYATVYGHSNLFSKGDNIQKNRCGDAISIEMKGAQEGVITSGSFDSDGMSLGEISLVKNGVVENYYGSNRFGQYLGEKPTGNLRCLCVAPGTADLSCLKNEPYLEVVSMSGLQVDFFSDYIGGEVRLAYYHDGNNTRPVTGISISGKLSEVLDHIRLSSETAVHGSYTGPAKAILSMMKVF